MTDVARGSGSGVGPGASGDPQPPAGYVRYSSRSGFTAPWEPLWRKETNLDVTILAVRLDRRHCNSRGTAHGGLITALADNAMSLACEQAAHPGEPAGQIRAATVNLSADFLATSHIGQWLSWTAATDRVGRSLIFAHCTVSADDTITATVSGIYRPMTAAP